MFEIGIIGAKNSGKTTLIEQLIESLCARKLHIATIKHTSHDHGFDVDGKDTYRHRKAGSCLTLATSNKEVALFASRSEGDLQALLSVMALEFDICLVEGDRLSDRPKILLTHGWNRFENQSLRNIVASYGSKSVDALPSHFELNEIELLADFIVQMYDFFMERKRRE